MSRMSYCPSLTKYVNCFKNSACKSFCGSCSASAQESKVLNTNPHYNTLGGWDSGQSPGGRGVVAYDPNTLTGTIIQGRRPYALKANSEIFYHPNMAIGTLCACLYISEIFRLGHFIVTFSNYLLFLG